MIEIKDLSLTFKNADEDHEALKAVTLDIPEGCIYGFVGSNGAGKSTLLRVISGIYRPDSGSVTIDETEVYDRPQAKENIFFVSDETVQFSRLTVNDLKSFYQSSYPTFDDKVFDDLISKLDLPRKKPLSQFSKGMKRQAIVAAALASRTKYILLDEAFDGLDPAMRRLIRTMIVDDIFDRGATLIVSSHNVTEIGELCDKAMLLHKGEVIFAKDIDDVREGFEKVQIALPEGELDRSAIENAGVEVLSFKNSEEFPPLWQRVKKRISPQSFLLSHLPFWSLSLSHLKRFSFTKWRCVDMLSAAKRISRTSNRDLKANSLFL